MEIKLPSCSNLHLFKNLHLFIDQNHIPIQITTTPETKHKISMKGGENQNTKLQLDTNASVLRLETDPAHIIYKSAYTPYTIFSTFLDSIFLQKQRDSNEDVNNQQLLTSLSPENKEISIPIINPDMKETPLPEEIPSLYLHIQSNTKRSNNPDEGSKPSNNPDEGSNNIESIRGTKLYYLYQRQLEDPTICAHLV